MPIAYPRFRVGELVVCVDDNFAVLEANTILKPPAGGGSWALPRMGQTYHVRDCIFGPQGWGILLREVRNPAPHQGWPELNFHQDRFAPLREAPVTEEVEEAVEEPAELVLV